MAASRTIKHGTIIVDDDVAHLLTKSLEIVRGTYSKYAAIVINGKRVRLGRAIMEAPCGIVVDHINGNPLDNRRQNLRFCTIQQNNFNRRAVGGTSVYKGVRKTKSGKWSSAIRINGADTYLGTFASEEDAARAYDTAARVHHGEFACVNFPQNGERSATQSPAVSLLPAGGASVAHLALCRDATLAADLLSHEVPCAE